MHNIKITEKNYHDKKIIITCHLFRNSLYNILGRDNCFFFVIIVFCNFLADYKAQKKKQLSQTKKTVITYYGPKLNTVLTYFGIKNVISWRLQHDNCHIMIMCSVLISYCVCRRLRWIPKTKPNDSSVVVWLNIWCSTRITKK